MALFKQIMFGVLGSLLGAGAAAFGIYCLRAYFQNGTLGWLALCTLGLLVLIGTLARTVKQEQEGNLGLLQAKLDLTNASLELIEHTIAAKVKQELQNDLDILQLKLDLANKRLELIQCNLGMDNEESDE